MNRFSRSIHIFLWLAIAASLISGCGQRIQSPPTAPPTVSALSSYPGSEPTSTPLPYPVMKQSETAQVATFNAYPTPTPIPPTIPPMPTLTMPPAGLTLPAPLYYFPAMFGRHPAGIQQIWRLERDCVTQTQITHAPQAIDEFDVATDGSLVYTSGNTLVLSDALGNLSSVLVEGIPPPANLVDDYIFHQAIRSPVWSPDGQRIAYFQDSLNVIDVKTRAITRVIPSAGVDPSPTVPVQNLPRAWTQDGKLILVHRVQSEGGSLAFVSPVLNGQLVPIDIPNNGCCSFSFTAQGKLLLSSGEHGFIGLWLVDPQSGKGEKLSATLEGQPITDPYISLPQQAEDGNIYFFTPPDGIAGVAWHIRLAGVSQEKIPFRVPQDVAFINAGGDQRDVEGMLWATDASLVILQDQSRSTYVLTLPEGQLYSLPIQASYPLHWGAP